MIYPYNFTSGELGDVDKKLNYFASNSKNILRIIINRH